MATQDGSHHERSVEELSPAERDALLHRIMARQLRLSAGVAAVFLAIVFGLPLLNWQLPELARTNVGGFTLSWLVLGVLFYPVTWGLSALFIKRSNDLEDAIVHEGTEAGR